MTEQVMVRMTPEMLASLERDAHAQERTVAQTVRLACKRFLGVSHEREGRGQ